MYQLACQHYNQRKVWIESPLRLQILSKLDKRLKRESRKIILFMDNAPCHLEDLDGKYDQNTTSRLQPHDLGVSAVFKRFLTHVVS